MSLSQDLRAAARLIVRGRGLVPARRASGEAPEPRALPLRALSRALARRLT